MSQVLNIQLAQIFNKNISIKILMIILNDIETCLLLIVVGNLFTLDYLSCCIYFLCTLICELSKAFIIEKQDSIVSWTVLTAEWHICLLVNDSLKVIWNRTCISVSILILKDDGCLIWKNLNISLTIYKRNSLYCLKLLMAYDYRCNVLVVAGNLPTENDIDQLSCIHGADIFRLKEFVIDNGKVIINLALDDHVLHEVLHGWSIFMVYLHMLWLIEDNICIQVCQLILCQSILVVKVHKNRSRNKVILLSVHASDVALIKSYKLKTLKYCSLVKSMILMIQHVCWYKHRADTGKHLQILIFLTSQLLSCICSYGSVIFLIAVFYFSSDDIVSMSVGWTNQLILII